MTTIALNGMNVYACDFQNAYLQAPSSEKHYVIYGPEFGLDNVGKFAMIIRALYGGESTGDMTNMHFITCKGDADVWMRPGKRSNGTFLAIMEEPEEFIRKELASYFTIKEKSIGPPT